MLFGEKVHRASQQARERGWPVARWLENVEGSSAYFLRLRQELSAFREWHGPPTFFLTVTLNSNTNDLLGAWVVHSSRQRGSPVEVLSAANERSLLKQLPRDRRKERIEKIEEKTVKV